MWPNISSRTPFGFIGGLLVIFGFIVLLAGFGVVVFKQQLRIRFGKPTRISGGVLIVTGIVFILIDSIFPLQPKPIIPTPQGTITMTADATSIFPSLTKDLSGKIFFTRSARYFMMMDSDGSNQVTISELGWNFFCPHFSPNHNEIVFGSTIFGPWDIYTIDIDGSGLKNLTNSRDLEQCAVWSPDGTKIIYSINTASLLADIGMMKADGSDQQNLTNVYNDVLNLGRRELYYSFSHSPWSPDGEMFVYYSNVDGDYEIYRMNSDGSERLKITNNQMDDYQAVLSPDGRKVAFSSFLGNDLNMDIQILDINDSSFTPINLTRHPANDYYPAWSPDGSRLVFVSDRSGNKDIYIMFADGTAVKRLTYTPEDEDDIYWLR